MLDTKKLLGFKFIQDENDTANALISAKIGAIAAPPPESVLTAPAPESGSTMILGLSSEGSLILTITGTRSGNNSTTGGTGVSSGGNFEIGKSIWGNISYGFGDVDNDGATSGFDYDSYGFTLGGDLYQDADKNAVLGLFGAYSKFDTDINDTVSSSEVNYYQLGIYGGRQLMPFVHLNAAASIGYADLSSSRAAGAGTAIGDTDGFGYSLGVEMSHDDLIPAHSSLTFSPFVSMQLDSIDMNSYSETGTGAASVTPDKNSQLLSTLGIKTEGNIQHKSFTSISSFSIGWAHEFLDDTASSQAALIGGGATFTNTAVDVSNDYLALEASYAIPLENSIDFTIDYTGKYNSDAKDSKFSAGLAYSW